MRSVCKILKNLGSNESQLLRSYSQLAHNFQIVVPQKVSPQISSLNLSVPLPPYAKFGMPPDCAFKDPEIKDEESIKKMRNSCRLAKRILDCAGDIIKPGITTDAIDKFVHEMAISNNAVRYFMK
jgi:methionyl aminopeptidase